MTWECFEIYGNLVKGSRVALLLFSSYANIHLSMKQLPVARRSSVLPNSGSMSRDSKLMR